MFDLKAIQAALQEFGLDGWLLYDFRGSNLPARKVLQIDGKGMGSRRLLYAIPSHGEPRKLVHRIESGALDHLPGEKTIYLKWQELEDGIKHLLSGMKNVAMEYSPRNANPYVGRVDAGTVELVRSFGVEPVGSGDLIQLFEASWSDDQIRLHYAAEKVTTSAYDMAWALITERVKAGSTITEMQVQQAIMDHFEKHGMVANHGPIVGVNGHGGDPHYEPSLENDTPIREGDYVLLDLWAKSKEPGGVYSDLTRVAYVGKQVPSYYEEIFQIVAGARDAAVSTVTDAFAAGRPLRGWEVDRACRNVIEAAGYGDKFVHRTGHSMGMESPHGNGANMDDLETHEERLVLPRTAFSVEPGIYLQEFGVRSEINVLITPDRKVCVTGGLQKTVLALLA